MNIPAGKLADVALNRTTDTNRIQLTSHNAGPPTNSPQSCNYFLPRKTKFNKLQYCCVVAIRVVVAPEEYARCSASEQIEMAGETSWWCCMHGQLIAAGGMNRLALGFSSGSVPTFEGTLQTLMVEEREEGLALILLLDAGA